MSGQENGEGATGKGSKPVAPSTSRSGDQPVKGNNSGTVRGRLTLHPLLLPLVVSGPTDQGEYRLNCPFRTHSRKDGTLTLSLPKRVFKCHACGEAGTIASLIAYREENQRNGSASPAVTAESPKQVIKRKVPLSEDQVQAWHQVLVDGTGLGYLINKRRLTMETILKYQIGWDARAFRYTIPVRDATGNLVNVRRYNPKGNRKNPKMVNTYGHGSPARLYPAKVLSEPELALCAGEWDCLLLNQNGIPAITGTGGEDTWRDEWSKLLGGKVGPVIYDCDEAGRKGRERPLAVLPGSWAVDLDPDEDNGYDVTKWFQDGRSAADLRELIEQTRPKLLRARLCEDVGA